MSKGGISMRSKIRYNSASYQILKAVAAVAVTGIAITAFAVFPGLVVVVRELLEPDPAAYRRARERQEKRIQQAVLRLRRRRLVRLEERGKEMFLVVTRQGISEVKKFEFEELTLPARGPWDGRWRLAMFDVPEKFKRGRETFRNKIHSLGFFPLQKSVFVFPHECREEIEFVAHFCDIARYTEYVTCDDLGQSEARVRKHFGLLL